MMKEYAVVITNGALLDLEQIYDYIAYVLFSPENAMAQYNRIADAILKLDVFPERFCTVDFNFEHEQKLRRMVVDNFSVFYLVQEDQVVVTNVLSNASDIEQRIKCMNKFGSEEYEMKQETCLT